MGKNRINENSPVRPMRAVRVRDKDADKLLLPQWVSPKFDGIRGIIKGGVVLSNTLTPIPNKYIQSVLGGRKELEGLDGELFVRDNFNIVSSEIMSQDGEPDFEFQVFDIWNMPTTPFEMRYTKLQMAFLGLSYGNQEHLHLCQQELCYTWEEILQFEEVCLENGFEGICGRYYNAPYKYGRGTLSDGCLFKRKPFEDGEAIIIGFEEQLANLNEPTLDDRGLTKRSLAQAGRFGKETLGKLICHSQEFGEIKIGTGTGLTTELKQFIWDHQELFLNQFVTFKFQRHGTLNKPRIALLDKDCTFEFARIRHGLDVPLED